jgi:cysteine desulfurase / selenocysteine lyase
MEQAIRELFPAAVNSVYLNSAAMTPVPSPTIRAINDQLEDVARNGLKNFYSWSDTRDRVRRLVAGMLRVKPDDIGFVRNTSDGLGAVAAGLPWQPGDNIVSCCGEFPANYYPWRKLQDEQGVELRLSSCHDGLIDVDELIGLIDSNTRLVTVSAIQYSTGLALDLERIGRAARAHDGLMCVDMIQAFGAMPLDLAAQFVDIAAGGSYKWLCAPEGCGVFFISERARDRIKPVSRGWTSVENSFDFDDREQPMVTTARAWETGMGGSALFFGLEKSLEMLSRTGVDRIAAYLGELTDFLCEIVPAKKYRIFSSRKPGERSQIVSLLPLNGRTSSQIAERLAAQDIFVSARGPLVRVSPHLFNNFADIERLGAAL